MPASADVTNHLDRSYASLRATFFDWSRLGPVQERTGLMQDYFNQANIGDTRQVGSDSVITTRDRAGTDAPTVLMVGSHDVTGLTPRNGYPTPTTDAQLHGPGAGRLLGATMAFVEGLKAVIMGGQEPVNFVGLSVGTKDEPIALVERFGADADVVVMTDAVLWSVDTPTITVGSRGRLEVTITLSANRPVQDAAYAGATLNPLNRLVETIAALRDAKGRVALPNFYERAQRPERDLLESLADDPWVDRLGGAMPTGSLTPIQRATQWPVINLLDISTNGSDDAAGAGWIPAEATARLAIYLVPDQRPVDVERTLRTFLAERTPETLSWSLRVDDSARPYLLDDGMARDAHTKAIHRVTGHAPIPVPGGGTIGAGEIHYATAAPVLFAGISGPMQRWGSVDEAIGQDTLEQGTAVAAELCLQIARRSD